jgi:tetratricopeptide (TPR) repeat protein
MDAPDGGGPEALAVSAACLYQDGQHAQALDVLSQLARERADDSKVAHNLGLAAHRAGVLTQDQLLAQMTALAASHTQLAAQEQAGGAAGGAAGGQTAPGEGYGSGGEAAQPPPALPDVDVSDTALPALNAAIVLWQTGRRSAALALAEPLWRYVEALPAGGQTRLCLLLLDAYLDACQPGKAQAVATYMATQLAASSPEVALTVHVARARAHVLEGSHKAAKRELKEASTVVTQLHHQGVAPAGGSVTGWVAQVQAHCLKAQQELSRCNTGKAVRLLAAAQAVAASEGRVDPDAAQQQQQGGEQQGSSSCAPLRATLAANGGAVLHAQGRHAAAAVAYEQALAWASSPAQGPLAHLAVEQVDAITYAAGASPTPHLPPPPRGTPGIASTAHLPISGLLLRGLRSNGLGPTSPHPGSCVSRRATPRTGSASASLTGDADDRAASGPAHSSHTPLPVPFLRTQPTRCLTPHHPHVPPFPCINYSVN